MQKVTEITETGCYLDSHRGHYIIRDMILLAQEFGYLLDDMERFVLDKYDECGSDENYPHDSLMALADDALDWLNIGENVGQDRPIKGQNQPPTIPDGYVWEWNDGDFGLYQMEDDEAIEVNCFCEDCTNGIEDDSGPRQDSERSLWQIADEGSIAL